MSKKKVSWAQIVWKEKNFITAAAWAGLCLALVSETGNRDVAIALLLSASVALGAYLHAPVRPRDNDPEECDGGEDEK